MGLTWNDAKRIAETMELCKRAKEAKADYEYKKMMVCETAGIPEDEVDKFIKDVTEADTEDYAVDVIIYGGAEHVGV